MFGSHSWLQPSEVWEVPILYINVKLVQLVYILLVFVFVHVGEVHDGPRIIL